MGADAEQSRAGDGPAEEPLRVVHPSWKNWWPLWLFGWLVVPAVVAVWLREAITLKVYRDRLFVSRGLVENDFEEIFIADIRTIDVRQTVRQRLARIGDLAIHTASRAGRPNVIRGLPRPHEIEELLVSLRQHQTSVERTVD